MATRITIGCFKGSGFLDLFSEANSRLYPPLFVIKFNSKKSTQIFATKLSYFSFCSTFQALQYHRYIVPEFREISRTSSDSTPFFQNSAQFVTFHEQIYANIRQIFIIYFSDCRTISFIFRNFNESDLTHAF